MGRSALLAAAALAAAACIDPRQDPSYGACMLASLGTCTAFPRSPAVPAAYRSCTSLEGNWLEACPEENRFGFCAFDTPDAGTVSTHYYPGLVVSEGAARERCDRGGGRWTPGPGAVVGTPVAQAMACDQRSGLGTCSDVAGLMPPEQLAALQALCHLVAGTATATPCPAERRSGTCSYPFGDGLTQEDRYYAAASAGADAAACAAGGASWTPG